MSVVAMIKRPVLPVVAVKAILGVGEDRIRTLIDGGALEFAFDIRLNGSERACVRVLTASVCGYQPGKVFKSSLDEALALVFPSSLETFRVYQIAQRLVCDKGHIGHLIKSGALQATAARRKYGESLPVARRSCVDFLKSRRVT
jgi:hypothetical protein